MLSIKGVLKVKKDEHVVSEKFKKREFVISDDHDQYPQMIMFQLAQDKTSLIDSFEIGSEITVYFNLRGREWTNKEGKVMYFNTLDAWKIEGEQSKVDNNQTPAQSSLEDNNSEEDELPF